MKKFLLVGLPLIIVFAVSAVVGTGVFATTDTSNTIRACVNNSSGIPHITNRACKDFEHSLSWNKRGPQGPQGPQGNPGVGNNSIRVVQETFTVLKTDNTGDDKFNPTLQCVSGVIVGVGYGLSPNDADLDVHPSIVDHKDQSVKFLLLSHTADTTHPNIDTTVTEAIECALP